MQNEQKVIGIDGCRGGWCAAIMHSQSCDIEYYEKLDELFLAHPEHTLVFIDMPMGLSDAHTVRDIDKRLRDMTKPHAHSSVFTPPCREALNAESYKEALEINRKITGTGISIQSWNIAPRILEVDQLLEAKPQLKEKTYESHPETCFYLLNKRIPIPWKKKTREGQEFRMGLLEKHYPSIRDCFDEASKKYLRKQVAKDDIIDALVLAVAAKKSLEDKLQLIQGERLEDFKKIPMRVALLPDQVFAILQERDVRQHHKML